MTRYLDRYVCRWIEWYQRNGGGTELLSVNCNFKPSCSEYAKQAITSLGTFRALPLIARRLRRCNDRDLVEKKDDPFMTERDADTLATRSRESV
jgi:putative component of membrane protein insertase Oxa1/YidC/SpoIIIJ protein YidD